jgi:hypothetical protein
MPSYAVPEWFASANIKTHRELQAGQEQLYFAEAQELPNSETATEKTGCNSPAARISAVPAATERWLDGLHDALTAASAIDCNVSKTVFQPIIVLQRPQVDVRGFTDSAVHRLALNLRADMITLKLDAMDELCWDFVEQSERRAIVPVVETSAQDDAACSTSDENNSDGTSDAGSTKSENSFEDPISPDVPSDSTILTEFEALSMQEREHLSMFYFGTRSQRKATKEERLRNNVAMDSLLHALDTRVDVTGNSGESPDCQIDVAPPTLLYVPDVKEFYELSYTGRRFFTRLRDYIKEQRKRGQTLLLVLSIDLSERVSSEGCICDDCPDDSDYTWGRVLSKLQINSATCFWVPWQTNDDSETTTPSRDNTNQASMLRENVQKLKTAVRSQFTRPSHGAFLSKSPIWNSLAGLESIGSLQSRALKEREIKRVTRQLIGRFWLKKSIDSEDLSAVLARLTDQCETDCKPEVTGSQVDGSEDTNSQAEKTSETDEEKDKNEAWKTKMDSIREDCNKYEQKVLAGVVNPGMLRLAL